jgi:hypothetical protein
MMRMRKEQGGLECLSAEDLACLSAEDLEEVKVTLVEVDVIQKRSMHLELLPPRNLQVDRIDLGYHWKPLEQEIQVPEFLSLLQ